ncbi:MAG: hypothetical protein JXR20_03530 [Balneola sp.]
MLSNFTSNISKQIALFVSELQQTALDKSFSFDTNESDYLWKLKWKNSQYLEESFEIELWSENSLFTLRGEHTIDKVMKQVNETYFLYENQSSEELLSKMEEILQSFKNAVLEINNLK